MSIEERMTIDERRKYLHSMRKRYAQAGRLEQGHLLDEMEAPMTFRCAWPRCCVTAAGWL